jgi:hypothetical protein
MRLAPPGIAGASALARRSTPPWGAYPVAVLAFRLTNASPRAVRTVKITYEVKVAEPWKGPGSLPPPGWEPRELWYLRRRYANCEIPPGGEVAVACIERTWWPRAIRLRSVEAGSHAFSPRVSSRQIAAAFGHILDPASEFWQEARVVESVERAALERLLVEADPPDWRGLRFEFVSVPLELPPAPAGG